MSKTKLIAFALIAVLLLSISCHRKRRNTRIDEEREVTSVAEVYARGMEYLEDDRPVTARKYFEQVTLREDAGDYETLAEIAMADAFYIEGTAESFAEAISRYRSFVTFNPTHEKAAYCWLQMGKAYMAEMTTPDRDTVPSQSAQGILKSLIENYPESAEAAEAKERLSDVNDHLAAHEIKVGDFHFKGRHYAGAIERYLSVERDYPEYWNMPLVHHRLGEANFRFGRSDKAVEYYQKVVEEAPGTKLAADAENRLARIEDRPRTGSAGTDAGLTKVEKNQKKHWWQFWRKGNKSDAPEGDLVKPREKRWWQIWKKN